VDRRNIVVIGASAGGLDAVRALVRPLEAGSPAALFLVTHLTPGPSRLDEILAAETALEVRFARDEEAIRPGTLLIAPPDRHLILERSRISLRRGPRENLWRPSIDVLFRSAAVAFASRVIGIILSGALDDGASGLRAVARCGGLCVVQTPADAPYPEMPECALRAVPDARVMSATELAAALPALVAEAAPPSAPIPDQIQLEARVAAGDEGATREIEARGEPTSLTCPECGGPLKRQPGTFLRFRCRLGHAFSSSTLEEASREALESSLWAAIRLLEQRANIDLTRSSQERDRGRIGAAGVYQERASETTGHAEVLREMLSKLPARSGGEPVQHQRRTSLG
jgi:two-component system chemotaxis response regulator CheB